VLPRYSELKSEICKTAPVPFNDIFSSSNVQPDTNQQFHPFASPRPPVASFSVTSNTDLRPSALTRIPHFFPQCLALEPRPRYSLLLLVSLPQKRLLNLPVSYLTQCKPRNQPSSRVRPASVTSPADTLITPATPRVPPSS
jgi:hypothetical protein